MAKIVKRYKRWTIKETTPRDGEFASKYWLFLPDADLYFDSPEWEVESMEEAISWIDNYDKPKRKRG